MYFYNVKSQYNCVQKTELFHMKNANKKSLGKDAKFHDD